MSNPSFYVTVEYNNAQVMQVVESRVVGENGEGETAFNANYSKACRIL